MLADSKTCCIYSTYSTYSISTSIEYVRTRMRFIAYIFSNALYICVY